MEKAKKIYDLLVIGGGSGGIASARRAAGMYGKKVALIEHKRLGGTCVNVGCVPKKLSWNTSNLLETFQVHESYGIFTPKPKFDWATLKENRDKYVKRLNGIYAENLKKSTVEVIPGMAKFISEKEVECNGEVYTAEHILIAVGNDAIKIKKLEGVEHTITSDGFFSLEQQPKTAVIVGGGYIGVELSGMFNAYGTDTTLVLKDDFILRAFDRECSKLLMDSMQKSGLKILTKNNITKVEKLENGALKAYLDNGAPIETDIVLLAVGRQPDLTELNIQATGIKLGSKNEIPVDEYNNTTIPNVYAIGDVINKVQLTPVAIKEGRTLMDRLFGGQKDKKMDYANIPSIVFGHPPLGKCGLTEEEAKEKYGADNIKVYKSEFTNMFYGMSDHKEKTLFRLVCKLPEEKILGLHCVGKNADEMVQGFSVAIKMGATKKDFDACVAIHPTASEEFVTMT